MKTRVILIRHTDTGYTGSYFLGRKDVGLTKRGIEHAKRIGKLLAREKIDKIYSSGLKRSIMTAEEIAKPHGLKVERKPVFNEIDFGIFDGLTREEVKKRYPELLAAREKNKYTFKVPEGESYIDAKNRVMPRFLKVFEENPGKTVIIVMHGVLMKIILKEITGKTLEDFGKRAGFGCRMVYEKSNERIKLKEFENE